MATNNGRQRWWQTPKKIMKITTISLVKLTMILKTGTSQFHSENFPIGPENTPAGEAPKHKMTHPCAFTKPFFHLLSLSFGCEFIVKRLKAWLGLEVKWVDCKVRRRTRLLGIKKLVVGNQLKTSTWNLWWLVPIYPSDLCWCDRDNVLYNFTRNMT